MRPNVDPDLPSSDDYRIAFEEYKLLITWTNSIADRRQETNNLFFGVSGAILTALSLALTQLHESERTLGVILSSTMGIAIASIWLLLLGRYREILRFKYAQLRQFEEALGLDQNGLVAAEEDFFRFGKPLQSPRGIVKLAPPSKTGRFGITLAERNLPVLVFGIFALVLLITIVSNFV